MAVKKDFSQLEGLKKQFEQAVALKESRFFYEECIRELAARFLAKVIRRTPVGPGVFEVIRDKENNPVKYKRGKNKGKIRLRQLTNGGVLRRAWTARTQSQAESGNTPDALSYVKMVNVRKVGSNYQIIITNPMQYASYVEYGHRQTPGKFVPALGKRLKKSWVNGKFMMTISEHELRLEVPNILRKKLNKYLREVLNGK
ncbi:HK97 gp10 family phage protein [Pectinatus frisingensis]|uniref:HK97 gp10 family phage protein n=1 Tax=Pectinatus frisingensis TaxID=865 RepID=UPI0018C6D409|nr:HK97 gp10 family phage protein [Pectinatus frisingensis]